MRFVRCKTTSGYEAMILTPEQAYAMVRNLREPVRTLTLLAAGTGLRISECLGLQWQDVDFANAMIYVRRTWTCGQSRFAQDQSVKGSCAAPSIAWRVHDPLEGEDSVPEIGGLGLSFASLERQTAARGKYARRRLSAASRSGLETSVGFG